MTKENEGSMAALALFGVFALIPMTIVVSAALNGYVLSTLWGWFVSPVFGLPSLSVLQSIGVCLVVSFLTHQHPPDVEEKERTAAMRLGRAAMLTTVYPLFVLLIGWCVHRFM